MSNTKRTDANVVRGFDALRITKDEEEWVRADFARQLERKLNAALIVAGVASKERGEWAVDRDALLAANETLQSALRVIAESLAREDPPLQISIGYARGTAVRALEEVANA